MEQTNPLDTIAKRVLDIRASIEALRAEESRLECEFYSGSFRQRAKQIKARAKHERSKGLHGVEHAETMSTAPIMGRKIAG